MISASHNPYEDNGIKLFGPDGYKLSDEVERSIEARIAQGADDSLADSGHLGRVRRLDDQRGRYIDVVKQSFPRDLVLSGLKVVVDCANGAAYRVAPTILYELGAEVIPLAVQPDGLNINRDCGATATDALCAAAVEHGADLGLALDGDADRVILADERGRVVDGDQLMALIGETWQAAGRLTGGGIVATVMSNLGLERYLGDRGLALVRTPVGDRYVVEQMRKRGINVGGEQSGHIVLSDYTTTGDGLIAALQVLAGIVRAGRPASEVTNRFSPLPQVLRSVRYRKGQEPLALAPVQAAIAAGEASLARCGRLLIRKSGTEPVIRVMAEGEDEALVRRVVDSICNELAAA